MFTNGKATYLLKKKTWLFNEKQTYYKMVEHRQGQRDYSAYFKMADWELAGFPFLYQNLVKTES